MKETLGQRAILTQIVKREMGEYMTLDNRKLFFNKSSLVTVFQRKDHTDPHLGAPRLYICMYMQFQVQM